MDDLRIIELYFNRDEQAIKETDAKYGKLCHSIAYNILNNHEDSEECVNDTYVSVWNTIPPTRPHNFMPFICKIARNLSLKRLEFMKRKKRSAEIILSLDELAAVLPDERYAPDVSDEDVGKLISKFLRSQEEYVRNVFIRKYFYFDSINRFPDLEVRRNSGERLLRLEIKCLQCIAEEKSANFDTLMKDIDPRTDYVVVCLWDWNNASSSTYAWDSVPQIYKIYIFHAYSLTALRDAYWLNKPPANIGDGYQGFDARYAVTCSNGHYSKEQGNYGKLTRIWKKGFAYRPAETEELLDTENEYLSFQKEIIATGFEILSKSHLRQLTNDTIEEIVENGNIIGYKANRFAYVQSNVRQILSFAQSHNATIIVTMTEKYRSNVYKIGATTVDKIADNEKPKRLLSIISQL